ncbi:hypothetical protein ACOSQ4_006662 [Xanthoceras sorbifolium]
MRAFGLVKSATRNQRGENSSGQEKKPSAEQSNNVEGRFRLTYTNFGVSRLEKYNEAGQNNSGGLHVGDDRSNMMESANWSDGVDTGASGPKNALSGVMHVGVMTRVKAKTANKSSGGESAALNCILDLYGRLHVGKFNHSEP